MFLDDVKYGGNGIFTQMVVIVTEKRVLEPAHDQFG